MSNRELEAQAAARRAAKAAAAAEKVDAAWRAAARKVGTCWWSPAATCRRLDAFAGPCLVPCHLTVMACLPMQAPSALPPSSARPQTLFRLQKVKESSWFWSPVRADEAPGYFEVVRRPMDLATISDKVGGPSREVARPPAQHSALCAALCGCHLWTCALSCWCAQLDTSRTTPQTVPCPCIQTMPQLKSGSYGAAHEFLADVQQVWENCLLVSAGSELGDESTRVCSAGAWLLGSAA